MDRITTGTGTSQPTCESPMSDEEYQIRVGLRCAKCRKIRCACKKSSK